MSPPESRDRATLIDMIGACSNAMEYVRGVDESEFYRRGQLISAVNYQIAVLGEAVTRVSTSLRERFPQVRWRDIAGIRHHLIHGYDQVMLVEVWRVVSKDLPTLIDQLRAIERELDRT